MNLKIILSIMILLLSVATGVIHAEEPDIILHYSFQEPTISNIVTIEGLDIINEPGTPILPMKSVNVLDSSNKLYI